MTKLKIQIAPPVMMLAAALGLAAFPASARAADPKPYRVGFNAWIGSIAFFVAREKGFFKEEGLDMQGKSFSAPGDGLPPLLTGDLVAVMSTPACGLPALANSPG